MKNLKLGLVGLALFLLGVILFILVVPTVQETTLGVKEYLWAIAIIFSTCMGFGICMIAIFDDEELRTPNPNSDQDKQRSS